MIYEVSVFYRMMTEEFKILPNQDTIIWLLKSYELMLHHDKSAQKVFKTMRNMN